MSEFNTLLKNAQAYGLAFGAADVTSDRMRQAIPAWFEMYFQDKPSEMEDPCQRIPYTIVQKLNKTVFSEYNATSKDAFADVLLADLAKVRLEAVQMALIGGECLLKPIPKKDRFRFVVVPRYNALVFGRNADGGITDIGTVEVTMQDRWYYTLLERRTVDERGYLTIRNKLFRSYNKENLGQAVPLNSIPQYEDLQEEYTFPMPVGSIGMISVKTPMVNCVDGSRDPVSVYAAAVGLIRNINRNEAQLNGEFERGESRIIVSQDMLDKDGTGRRGLKDHVFVGLDEDQDTTGITVFSPALREASFLARKQEYLRNVENVIGLKRGLLSEVEAAERTATEITSSAGDYNLTVIDFQGMWESAVRETMQLCGVLGQLYKVEGAHEVAEDAVSIDWGNGVLYDEQKTWEDYKGMVASGLLKPEIALGWRFNMPAETKSDLAKIRKKYMPAAIEEPEEVDE